MIKRLRIRFVAVFFISMSILVSIVMGCIFGFMCSTEVLKTKDLLEKIVSSGGIDSGYSFYDNIENNQNESNNSLQQVQRDTIVVYFSPKSVYPVSYQFATDNDFHKDELFMLSYQINMNKTTDKTYGVVELTGVEYRYLLSNNILVLVDKTYEIDLIKRLSRILLISEGVTLLILLTISIILSIWITAPIERSWKKQKEFIADASHELKTPLTVIDANIDVVLNNNSDTIENQRKWLENIKEETESMSLLVNDMLYVAKTDANKDKFEPVKFNLSDVTENLSLGFETMAFEKGKRFVSNIEPDINYTGDKDLIKQLIKILLDNAIKYSAENGNIFLELKKNDKNKIYLVVSNDGELISDNEKKLIFERFYRTDKSRARVTGGSGLGLSIAKTIVKRHNGAINVQTIDNKYNSFVVIL